MSSSISSVSQTNPYVSSSASSGSNNKYGTGSATSQPAASSSTTDSATLSNTAQFRSLLDRYGMKVEGGTLGQLFSPAFFSESDANNDAHVSPSEFTSLVEQNGGNASLASRMYQEMGGGDDGLSYSQFRQGVGQGSAKDFFNGLVMTRIHSAGSDPAQWLQGLVQLGNESDAAAAKISKEMKG